MSPESAANRLPCTWDDYRSWDDGQRRELIGGEAYAMSPAPTVRHQGIQVELVAQMQPHFRSGPSKLFSAPTDVKLTEIDVVQPDLLVVCTSDQIRLTHIEGGPALVVEILSPSTAQRDRILKMDLYARAGVKEVWLVTPFPACVEVYVLDGQGYRRQAAYDQTMTLRSPSFPDLDLGLGPVFDFPLEPGEEPPAVKEPPGRYRAAAAP